MNTIINASLPVIIEVLEKTSWWRYNLRFGARTLSTKSQVPLEIGALYFANINHADGGVISINSLKKRPNDAFIAGGEQILEQVIESGDMSLAFEMLKNRLALCDNASEFDTLCATLVALNSGVLSLPFYYENLFCQAQIKSSGAGIDFYLLFGSFAPFIAHIENAKITHISTPYESFSRALSKVFACDYETKDINPLWVNNKNILDFKG